jgi:large conductance mechanosensitive channel
MKKVVKIMWKEFKKFAFKGNMIELAIGVVIGAAFGKVVTSLVNDIIMPVIGRLVGRVDFSKLYINLSHLGKNIPLAAAQANGDATLNYGLFINNILDFLIVAFSIFIVIRQLNRFKRKEEAKETTKKCDYCCTDIPIEATRCPHCTSELNTK